ncbi:MAG: transposase [Candidatus Cloacimonetes bacterium]|nr:transposase [Candidatus Cloacimonadota bacterium]
MRCKREQFTKGNIFHLYNHSIAEINLFRDYEDYEYFLDKFRNKYNSNEMEVFAYCLMPDHYHFCIEQLSKKPLFKIFNSFITSYSMYYNRKYYRSGSVFAGKLQHKMITDDDYLLLLCKYIHYNPVNSGFVENIEDWKYSNYLEYIGERRSNPFSRSLIKLYQGEFNNYAETIREYEKSEDDENFQKLTLE